LTLDTFTYRDGELYAEHVPLSAIAAEHGTPTYVYSRAAIEQRYRAFDEALSSVPHRICYAVKANSNIAVLQVLARVGSGFDIVSGGELRRVIKAGGDPAKVVFSGVGKTADELDFALASGIGCFNVESEVELWLLDAMAKKRGMRAPIALRVNPDVDPKTHPYISTGLKQNKFGIDLNTAERLYRQAQHSEGLRIIGIASHIGSQLLDVSPYLDALDRVLAVVDRLAADGIVFEHLDVGGGQGVRYRDEQPLDPAAWASSVLGKIKGRKMMLYTEPGRAIVGEAGVLLTRVELLKPTEDRNFAIVDAAMNDLLRPSLYQAWMDIVSVRQGASAPTATYDIVGPVCESGDWLGKQRDLSIMAGDLLAVRTAGAYGFVMSSNYNTRGRAAEVMVDGERASLVRQRESFEDLIRNERLLDEAG
jgi:diaminopimelate decarboxylase